MTGPDGYHLARFLGVLPGRAEARLVGAAATPHGDMSGIVYGVLNSAAEPKPDGAS